MQVGVRPRRSVEGGFSLVELVISVVVALLALAGIVQMVLSTAKTRRVDEEMNLALAACISKMEELRDMDFDLLASQDGRGYDVVGRMGETAALRAEPTDPDGRPLLVDVDKIEDVDGEILYRVEVSVEWEGVSGDRSFSLVSVMTDRRG